MWNSKGKESSKIRRLAISSYYIVYLQEFDYDVGPKDDSNSFSQVTGRENSTLWYDVVKEEIESKAKNKISDLIELPQH